MKKKTTTLKDVAISCGVSSTAVSLVLNNKPSNLSEKTKELIKETAAKLGYRPDPTARSLATKKTNTIGVIIPDISNAFFSEAVRHIQVELSKYGYDMFLCNTEEKYANDLKYLELLISRNVDGLILTMSAESLTMDHQDTIKSMLKESKIPYVLFDRFFEGNESKVYVDNEASGYEMTKHILQNGHTNIGVITGPLVLNSSRDRLKGVKRALKESGIELEKDNVVTGFYDMETGRIGGKKLLNQVSAIFAFNDLQAFGVIETAKQLGKQIPQDVSLVGFDDIFYSAILETQLTTVRQPIYDMSKAISDLLMKMVSDIEHHEVIKLPAVLIQRNSVKKI